MESFEPQRASVGDAVRSAAPEVEVRRSARRVRTAQARWQDGRIVVMLPAGMPASEERRMVDTLVARVTRQQRRRESERTDEWLSRRAVALARQHLDPVVGSPVRPRGVRWVATMRHRWGSCTPATGQIRLSDVLSGAPDHVVDAVLVHELAHLVEPGHTPRFRRLEAGYPRLAESRAWLAGWSEGYRMGGATREVPADLDADTSDPAAAERPLPRA